MRGLAVASLFLLLQLACVDVTMLHWQRESTDCNGAAASDWAETQPAEAGFDASALDALAKRIELGEFANLHSLLVVRDGKLVFERYFTGRDMAWGRPLGDVTFAADTLHDLRSVTKSVVGALVGIAHGDGALPDLDAPLVDFFPELAEARATELAGIELRHALTMTAGLAWDEFSHPYWDPRNNETGMWLRDDPVAYVLDRDIVAAPGERFAYNGGLPTVLAAIVEKATGKSIWDFARERLWCPLGVSTVEWLQHGSGTFVAASGLRLSSRDLARFGQMMLDDGRFAGRQIVPAKYVRASLDAQIDTQGSLAEHYGYQWWIASFPRNPDTGRAISFPVAIGNGGQRISVHRAARLVVVVTAGDYDSAEQGIAPTQAIRAVLGAINRD